MIRFSFMLLLLTSNIIFGQANQNGGANGQANQNAAANGQGAAGAGSTSSTNVTNNPISFLVGGGPSYIATHLYEDPVVNKTNNNVVIADATHLKTNLSVGIAYTPYLWDITSIVHDVDANGKVTTHTVVEHVPKGITMVAFINPVSLTKATESQPFFNILDFGFGLGHRFAGGLSILGTVEFFGVSQPRQWFVDQFKGNSSQYMINNAAQNSIDPTDNSIFRNKIATTFGIKFAYTFDIIKNFYSQSQTLTAGGANANANNGANNANPNGGNANPGPNGGNQNAAGNH